MYPPYEDQHMTRHPENPNLTLSHDPTYQGFSVQSQRGPLIHEYLDISWSVIQRSLQDHNRVFAVRFDLRFPENGHHAHADSNLVIERFISSLKAKIRHNRNRAREANRYAHHTSVRYIWCRELGQHGVPHYHVALLLNNDAYCTLGIYALDRPNLFSRIHEAWASALGTQSNDVRGLVEFPQNPYYLLQRNDPIAISDFFYRVSYLCKADTKYYGSGVHSFGASRN